MEHADERLQNITTSLENEFLVELALVYGSTARGDFRPDSDVDIAVAGKELIPVDDLADIAARIEKHVGVPVDIIDRRASEGLILYEAVCGIPLVDNSDLRAAYMIKALSFKEDFLPQLNALRFERAKRFISGC